MPLKMATVEQAIDDTWTAVVIGEHTVLGNGETREAALDNLQQGIDRLVEYLKDTGRPVIR